MVTTINQISRIKNQKAITKPELKTKILLFLFFYTNDAFSSNKKRPQAFTQGRYGSIHNKIS